MGAKRARRSVDGRRRLPAPTSGQATIESAGLTALLALILIGVIAVIASGGEVPAGRELAGTIGKRLTCAPHLPDACDHQPLWQVAAHYPGWSD